MIGKTVSHYKIISQLGAGGMGVVYQAEDLDLKVTRALKFLPPHLATDDDQLARLKHEARAAAALEHPNICQVHEIGHDQGQTFIVMSYLEGRTLEDRLAKEGPLSSGEAMTIAAEVGAALKRAHAAGIVHRDIKPANIMLTDGGQAVVMDFGLAMAADFTRMTKTGTALGTASYMSPEQINGEQADARSDIWSLGVVLYEMLTGIPPFKGDNLAALAYAIQHKEPDAVTQTVPGCSADLEKVIDRMLAKDSAQRYQTSEELLEDLRAVGDEQDLALKTAMYDRRRQLKRRKRLLFGVLATALIAAVTLVWWSRYQDMNRIDALAVLPFANLSGNEEQEYIADGMTEILITELQQLVAGTSLRVVSRTSVMQYKGTEKTLGEIARELGVDALVEASVVLDRKDLRISAKLIRARPEQQIWANSFEGDLADALSIQAQIAGTIAGAVAVELSPEAEARLEQVKARVVDPQAMEAYLRAREDPLATVSRASFDSALRHYQEAITLDPEFGIAYAGLACLYTQASLMTIVSPHESLAYAKLTAQKALELDPRSAEALLAKATVGFYFDWDWEGPDGDFQQAIDLNPNDPEYRIAYGTYLVHRGFFDEAIEIFRMAEEMTPGDYLSIVSIGWANLYANRPEPVISMALELLENDPDDRLPYFHLAWAYSLLGKFDDAVASADSLGVDYSEFLLADLYSVMFWMRGKVYAEAGRRDKALEMIQSLLDLSTDHYIDPWYVAQIHERLGNLDEAFALLEEAFEMRSTSLIDLRLDMGHLADDPRYQDLARRVGIPLD